jgi:primosomal protein N' (replication factor Y)
VAEVAVAVPIGHHLSYEVPAALESGVVPGVRVRVPVGNRMVAGFVVAVERDQVPDDPEALKSVQAVLETRPCLVPSTLRLGLWVARYYGAAPGEALQALVPAAVRHGRSKKEDVLVELVDAKMASSLLVERRAAPSWEGRCRVLRALLDGEGPLRQAELLRIAHVSVSPISTLEAANILRRRRVHAPGDPFSLLRPIPTPAPPLTEDQARVLAPLRLALDASTFSGALLHGITGSGKTEVYLQLLERCLAQGRTAILLVPEIALTPQTIERILARIPEVAVLHSHLSDGDRAEQWQRLRRGEVKVAVGPRSAIFAPLQDLGLIILDEEHESTFKQQQSPRYHARDVALERGRLEGALVILGTATPSLEAEQFVDDGVIARLSMPARVGGRPLPKVSIIDMRHEKPVGPGGIFSGLLVRSMEETLNRGGQVMLFLNRRGFSTFVLCRQCGWRASCTQCAIQLTHHQKTDRLLCHYCGQERAIPRTCPDCDSPHVRYGGFGTEKVAAAALHLFPERHVARMDGETLQRRGAPERLFQELRDGTIDILVGTQALAKGLDIAGVTLVGVVSADTALLIPDFRSSERTFQVLCQVAGRAGRGDRPGTVLIQSYCPEHEAIQAAARHDHEAFVRCEMAHRREFGYPPASHMARVVAESPRPEDAAKALTDLGVAAASWPEVASGAVTVMGPAPCPIERLKGQYRYHLLLIGADAATITDLLPRVPRRSGKTLRILVDRDPVALM